MPGAPSDVLVSRAAILLETTTTACLKAVIES